MKNTLPAVRLKLLQLIKRLQNKPPRNLDYLFQDAHDTVFEQTDCLTCANCCKTTSPMFFAKDIERLSSAMGMKESTFMAKYLFLDEDGIYALKQSPCPFLGTDNHCAVYESRPKACREFPHTNHRKMHTHLHLMKPNMEICPAVSEILLRISGQM
ncbi:MAG: YkgJ family cysteine cluster protein [Bacteroidetes bacterium]|nr:YkgJ family cysteine cluster protein [Bacteroidota bacterium]